MRTSILGAALALAVASGAPRAAAEGGEPAPAKAAPPRLHLAFEGESETTAEMAGGSPPAGTPGSPAPERSPVRIEAWLGPTSVVVARDGRLCLHDFAAGRLVTWTPGDEVADSLPLEAGLDFRVEEFGNRLKLRGALEKVQKVMPAFEVFELETVFGLEAKPPAARKGIEITETAEALAARHGGERVVWAEPSDTRPPPALAASWARFLRWETRIHPAILERLLAGGRIPKALSYRSRNIGKIIQVTLRLAEADDGEPPPIPVGREARCDPSLRSALEAAAAAKPPDRAKAMEEVRDLRAKGRTLDAYLALLSYSIATGDSVTGELRDFLQDPAGKAVVVEHAARTGRVRDRKGAEAARDWLAEKRKEDLAHGYLLDVFRANFLAGLGDLKGARALFVEVLGGHPELAGAWHDLGQVLRNDWDMDGAWRCWEVAFRLAPGHAILGDSRKIRDDLRREHREFLE